MAITKPTKPKTADEFISGAPDAGRKGVRKGRKEQITVTLAPEMITRLDYLARRWGQSRAAVIGMAVVRILETEGAD